MSWSQSLFDSELSRRDLLVGFTAAAVTTSLTSRTQAAPTAAQDERLESLLTRQFEQQLESDPTLATSLGLDAGAHAALRSKFPDWSAEGRRGEQITRENAGLGVVAPGFILEQAIRQLRKLRDGNAREKTLVRSIAQRSRAVEL